MSTLKVDAIGKFDTTANAITFDSNNNVSFTGSVDATNPMMNKNLLINGGMNVWQRSTARSSRTTSGYWTADRYEMSITTLGTWTQSRSTDVPSAQGFGYSLKMDCTTADASPAAGDYLLLQQKIEGQNLQHLLKGTSSAKKLTISFWVKSSKTGTYICEIDDNDNTRNINKSYTINSADTWEKKTITYDGDTSGVLDNDNDHSLRVMFWLGGGSDFTSGTLQTSWGSTVNANRAVGQVNLADSTSNEWYMTGCQLEVGSTASGFEFEPFEATLRKCHRYCRQWDRRGPSEAPEYTRAVYIGGVGQLADTTSVILTIQGLRMRGAPDVEYSATNDFTFSSTSGSETSSALAVYQDGTHGALSGSDPTLDITVSTGTDETAGRVFINDDTNGYLRLSAEL